MEGDDVEARKGSVGCLALSVGGTRPAVGFGGRVSVLSGDSTLGTEGDSVGAKVGSAVDLAVSWPNGDVGIDDGAELGDDVGIDDGAELGVHDGAELGDDVGIDDGAAVGANVGLKVGAKVGDGEGLKVGAAVGDDVGSDVGGDVGR